MESNLSRRERQIMDIIYEMNEASASEVVQSIEDPPSRTAIRTILGILVDKGFLVFRKMGREYIYKPTSPRKIAGQSAFRRAIKTFFDGSLEEALEAHFADPKSEIAEEEMKRLMKLIKNKRNKEKS